MSGWVDHLPHLSTYFQDFFNYFITYQPYLSAPTNREGRKIDVLGRWLYSLALGLKIANYETIIVGYQLFLWERILPFLEFLPEDMHPLAKILHAKTIKFSTQ